VTQSKKNISIIYYQKNDSPKYLEINKQKFIIFLVGLPTITLIALTLGTLGLIQTSPFHLIDNYRQNAKARIAVASSLELQTQLSTMTKANKILESQLELLKSSPAVTATPSSSAPEVSSKAAPIPEKILAPMPLGLSTLSLFRPINGQKDKTQPAPLNLTGFKVSNSKDNINFQFNIINLLGGDVKLAGHIIVLMKNEQSIQVYPQQALVLNDAQIHYSSGEPFATQRFRPVDASFFHPKKSGNYMFIIYIFSKTGDLLHYQTMTLPVHL
jgi:hypothetical protein